MRVLYICDRQACEKCHYPTCRHTTDVRHTANFKPSGDGANAYYMEKESKNNDRYHNMVSYTPDARR